MSRADAAPSQVLVAELGPAGESIELDEDESHYLAHVCRARSGDSVSATDGRGTLARLTLLTIGSRVVARVESSEHRVRAGEAIVWCGAPEGTRADWLVEKLAELGVSALQPLEAARGRWELGAAKHARLSRLTRAALRQSRSGYLMRIEPPRRLDELCESIPSGASLWLADPAGARTGTAPARGVTIGAIGPASGFDEAEKETLAGRGFQLISLAGSRLRTETAALAWAAWWARQAES